MADAVAEAEHGGIVRMLKDLFAGAAGGVAQVLIGMGFSLPFLRAAGTEIETFLFGHVPEQTSFGPLFVC